MSAHAISRMTYFITLVALLILTVISFALAQLELGAFEMPAALLIAGIKCVLVLLFFMHLAHASIGSIVAVLTGVIFVAILLGLIATDIGTRPDPGPRLPFGGVPAVQAPR